MNWVGIVSANGSSHVWYQAITWNNTGLLSIGPLGTKFSAIWIKIQNVSFINMSLKISSVKWQRFCPRGDEFNAKWADTSLSIHHANQLIDNILLWFVYVGFTTTFNHIILVFLEIYDWMAWMIYKWSADIVCILRAWQIHLPGQHGVAGSILCGLAGFSHVFITVPPNKSQFSTWCQWVSAEKM